MTEPVRIYIAGPYTRGDIAENLRRAVAMADVVLAAGHVPFVPHLTHLWHLISPKPYETWLQLDLAWLDQCQVLIRLPGESHGADAEVAYAKEHGIPVVVWQWQFDTKAEDQFGVMRTELHEQLAKLGLETP